MPRFARSPPSDGERRTSSAGAHLTPILIHFHNRTDTIDSP